MLIQNECQNPPYGLLSQVRRCLGWISPLDLDGLAYIRLTDEIEEPTDGSPDWHRRARAEGRAVTGMYVGQREGSPAHVILYVRDLYRGIPFLYWWTTVPTLNISHTLAHEVGHHLIAKRGYIFQPGEKYGRDEIEEEFCNRYAVGVTQKMLGRWYYRLGMWALKDLAGWHYVCGCSDWKGKKYKKAAERFQTCFHLDRDREDALNWYWRAKDKGNA